jgi:hypothetical protein
MVLMDRPVDGRTCTWRNGKKEEGGGKTARSQLMLYELTLSDICCFDYLAFPLLLGFLDFLSLPCYLRLLFSFFLMAFFM